MAHAWCLAFVNLVHRKLCSCRRLHLKKDATMLVSFHINVWAHLYSIYTIYVPPLFWCKLTPRSILISVLYASFAGNTLRSPKICNFSQKQWRLEKSSILEPGSWDYSKYLMQETFIPANVYTLFGTSSWDVTWSEYCLWVSDCNYNRFRSWKSTQSLLGISKIDAKPTGYADLITLSRLMDLLRSLVRHGRNCLYSVYRCLFKFNAPSYYESR